MYITNNFKQVILHVRLNTYNIKKLRVLPTEYTDMLHMMSIVSAYYFPQETVFVIESRCCL